MTHRPVSGGTCVGLLSSLSEATCSRVKDIIKITSKMEVEARVSVQAMRGRFEQLHEDTPLANSSAQINTSPVRARTASVQDTHKSSDGTKPQKKLLHPTKVGEQDHTPLTTGVNNGSTKELNNESFLSEIISPLRPSSKTIKALSHRKHSIDSQAERRNHSEIRTHRSILNKSADDKLDTCGTQVKPSVVRRIPVFKSVDTGLNSQEKKLSKEKDRDEDEEEPVTECHEKRGRFFGHIRSRSHGSFIIKRDSSVEKKGDSNIKQKDSTGILNKDWLIQKRKPKSNDSLFNNQDSKSNSTFEGKQKIVANVVRNMKNKEKPKVFRKLSFSSKTEKEIKNKKEKSITPRSKDKKIGRLSSPDKADNLQLQTETNAKDIKIDGEPKLLVDSKRRSNAQKTSPLSGAAVATVSIAKAVADVALTKSGAATSTIVDSGSSHSSGDTLVIPPARPPRRRSSGAGLTPHKKGKAPSPPSLSSPSPISPNQIVSDKSPTKSCTIDEILQSSDISSTEIPIEFRLTPDINGHRYTESPDLSKSSESLLSSQSLEKTRENSPIMINQDSSPSLSKRSAIAHSPIPGPLSNQKYNKEWGSTELKCELQSVQLETNKEIDISTEDHRPHRKGRITSKSTECLREKVNSDEMLETSENTKPECIPVGPPPRKPPRTFAYDIYRNGKTSNGEEVQGEKESGEINENSQAETPPPQPIYAVPLKKKKNNKNFTPKPPIRSKSDLTDHDISKPSIAPKPAHIITKAKRASVVDPLSSTEKDEEAAITSEFQKQAHIRYSLRRPKKPPPAPPPCTDIEGNATNHCVNSPCIPDATRHVHINRRSSLNDQISHLGFKNAWDVNSNHKQMHDENSPPDSLKLRTSHFESLSSSQSISANDYEDIKSLIPAIRATSTCNLEANSTSFEADQPLSLGYCCVNTSSDIAHLYRKRSMSDETLYKGSRRGDEPIYATPIFTSTKGTSNHNHQRELHYMEEADAGRDGSGRRHRRNSTHGKEKIMGNDVADGNRARSGLISAWKRDFRQSCRQVQNKIKKTVIR
ncbi:muscle M-line assembly protein unc-89 isoform X2 [Procambarus clarkii]|uniref:muscle M-line assembly protein unc-89 isoform X2 n=1 Tax=Procambarus clarkii TaxID=6728 RepID=UPI003742CFBC